MPVVSEKQNAPVTVGEENRHLALAEKRKKASLAKDRVHGLVPHGSMKTHDHSFYWSKPGTANNVLGNEGEQAGGTKALVAPTRNNNLPWKRRATNLIMNYGIISKGMDHAESKNDTAVSAVDAPHADEHNSEASQVTRAYEYDDFAKMHVAEERALVATSPKPKPTAYRRPKRNMNSKKKKRKKKVPEYRYIPDVGYVLEKDSSDDEACGDSGMTNAQQQYKTPATSTLDLFRRVNGTYILQNIRKSKDANMPYYDVIMRTGANVSGVTVTRATRKGRSSRGSSRSPTSSSSSQSPEWKGQRKKSLVPQKKSRRNTNCRSRQGGIEETSPKRNGEGTEKYVSCTHLHSHESKLTNTQNCLVSQRHVAYNKITVERTVVKIVNSTFRRLRRTMNSFSSR